MTKLPHGATVVVYARYTTTAQEAVPLADIPNASRATSAKRLYRSLVPTSIPDARPISSRAGLLRTSAVLIAPEMKFRSVSEPGSRH